MRVRRDRRRAPRPARAVLAVRGLSAAMLLGGAYLTFGPTPAGAVAPQRTAWWNEAPLGLVPLSSQVGPNELAVGQGAGGPTAVAAVEYSLSSPDSADPGQAGATLSLPINTGSSVGTPAVVACPVAAGSLDWKSGGDQSGASAPKYTCSPGTAVKGASPDGNSLVFDLTPAQQVAGAPGTFNLAIVPDPASSAPFQTVVEAPRDNDFTVSNPPEGGGGTPPVASVPDQSALAGSPAPATPDLSSSAFVSDTGSQVALPPPAAAAPSPPAPSSGPRSALALRLPGSIAHRVAASAGFLGGRRQQVLGVWLMIDAGLAVVFFGGGPERAPRLLGSLASRRGATAPLEVGAQLGGIGRFARPRTGPPRRL